MKVTIYGASDDLIEVDGDISEEFPLNNTGNDGDVLAFSDGTILRIAYTDPGVWRITKVAQGTATLTIEQAPEDVDDDYTDRATLVEGDQGDLTWVVHGIAYAKAGA
jgi:hypothetical protein